MHQSLGNLPKLSLITAINAGFLRGAPHLDIKSITKYLMPSPATSKGHMKRPRKGLRSTTQKPTGRPKPPSALPRPPSIPGIHADAMPGLIPIDDDDFSNPDPAFISTSTTSPSPMCFVSVPLPAKIPALCKTIAQGTSRSCPLMVTSVSS